jgi:hypothetical protein
MTEDGVKKYSWLYDNIDNLKEKIIFRDRTEYRISGELHNHKGPAVIHTYDPLFGTHPDEENFEEYYLRGLKMTKEQWLINTRKYKVNKIIKKTKEETNE